MKRIGYLVFCFCAAARAAARTPRRSRRLIAAAAPTQKTGLIRILFRRSLTLALDAVLLGTAAVLLALRFAPKRSPLDANPLLKSGAERSEDATVHEQEELAFEASDPDLQPIDLVSEEQVTAKRYNEEPAAMEPRYATLPASAESTLPSRPITTPGPSSISRFSALREVLFANGLPDLQRIGRRGEMVDYRDPEHLYMDLDVGMAPGEPAPLPVAAEELPAAHATPSRSVSGFAPPVHSAGDQSEESAVLPPFSAPLPFLPLFRPARREQEPRRSRLERGESLDGIQILPSRPGQYRRKS